MTTTEAINLAALIVGPVAAVIISLWIEGRRKTRDQKLVVLRLLIATRHFPSDPNYQLAINLIPLEFGKSPEVMRAYTEFLEAAAVQPTLENQASVGEKMNVKKVRMIFEVARTLGFKVRETDIQHAAYASKGWVERESLLADSQKAARDLVNVLIIQARLMAGGSLSEQERAWLGISQREQTEQ